MNSLLKNKKIVIIGAGLVGTLLSLYLSKKGHFIEIFESRSKFKKEDPHSKKKIFKGTSINLALSARGIKALKKIKIDLKILNLCVPMNGRITHSKKGELYFQPYGLKEKSEAIYSVPRGLLDQTLLQLALKEKNIKIHFNTKLEDLNLKTKKIFLKKSSHLIEHSYDVLFGTDGARSCVRKSLEKKGFIQTKIKKSHLAYKEILISPLKKRKNFSTLKLLKALHIWPRKKFMLIALPNLENFFTGTLFMPLKNEKMSFESLEFPFQIKKFFQKEFPDVSNEIIDLEKNFLHTPVGSLSSIESWPWFYKDQVLIMGDATHATLPFFGQGMNASFEDVRIFFEMLEKKNQEIFKNSPHLNETNQKNKNNKKINHHLKNLFEDFSKQRRPQIASLSQMTNENDLEMREKMNDSSFLLKKKLELFLEKTFPEHFKSRYGLVSFTHTPYKEALERGKIQDQILKELIKNKKNIKDIDIKKAKNLIFEFLTPLKIEQNT